jgi:electron transport complex protein RnfB
MEPPMKSIVDRIDEILPQTQCRQCHFDGCRPYAEAIAEGGADINQCPPGGETGIGLLAELLEVDPKPLNPAYGREEPLRIAVIVENDCIGCAKCIEACPVDAIVGAQKQTHTVIEGFCTGCELCLPPCPVDCIDLNSVEPGDARFGSTNSAAYREFATASRVRFEARNIRLERQRQQEAAGQQRKRAALLRLKASRAQSR